MKRNNFESFPVTISHHLTFVDTFAKTISTLDEFKGKNVRVAYSGGADSDTVMWLLRWLGYDITGVIYDTGLEYDATWNHVEYMRSEGFKIERIKARRPIPTSQHKYGHAFVSKKVADMLQRLQKHEFDFQNHGNLSFEELMELYPNTKSALRWWTNNHISKRDNISWNIHLKEFLIEYGLPFKVSGMCCDGAKKLPIKEYTKENNIDLMILGIRRAEGGARASAYKGCFVPKRHYTYDMYFPLFWWKDSEKEIFDSVMAIKHSDTYEKYGLKRTGCAGCPFGRNFEDELDVIDKFEPKLSRGIRNIFGEAYDWTREFNAYKARLKDEKK